MPNIKSAAKRLKSNAKKETFNRMRKSRVHTYENILDEVIKKNNKEEITAALSKCFSELDKAAKTGVIHQNKADRKKQRLATRIANLA
ncbi:MAG: 30S ribosomal protein S20 [Lentisphaeria bacterium]